MHKSMAVDTRAHNAQSLTESGAMSSSHRRMGAIIVFAWWGGPNWLNDGFGLNGAPCWNPPCWEPDWKDASRRACCSRLYSCRARCSGGA